QQDRASAWRDDAVFGKLQCGDTRYGLGIARAHMRARSEVTESHWRKRDQPEDEGNGMPRNSKHGRNSSCSLCPLNEAITACSRITTVRHGGNVSRHPELRAGLAEPSHRRTAASRP